MRVRRRWSNNKNPILRIWKKKLAHERWESSDSWLLGAVACLRHVRGTHRLFSVFWSYFSGPSRGSHALRERFLCPKKRFSAKKFYNFFYHIFYKNVYKCLFRPSGDLPDLSGRFRTHIFIYLMYLSIYKYIY